ncbi:MAG TPA: hypothetical protein GXZ90_05700, partial [Clostridiales bacterium]|nr:hypothetical protein [Clostridiales bacterium]
NKNNNIQKKKLSKEKKPENIDATFNGQSNYDMVLILFKEGKSVLDISKTLNIGQGEVKLIIDLETR